MIEGLLFYLQQTGLGLLALLVAVVTGYAAVVRIGRDLIDYWFVRWDQREQDKAWQKRHDEWSTHRD